MEQNDRMPTKLYVVISSDADNLLEEAATSNKFFITHPRNYDIASNGNILCCDTKLNTKANSFEAPFIIVKSDITVSKIQSVLFIVYVCIMCMYYVSCQSIIL